MEIIDTLKAGICQINITVTEEDIPHEEGLIAAGILDSFGFVEFIAFIEKEYNIEIGDDEITMDNFKHLSRIADFIKEKF